MALIGAKGVALIVCFLIMAGLIEYVIILHIHSGQRRVPFSDWDNPRISDGFSKVDSVEVENLEARFKKIKIFPAGGSSSRKDRGYWKERGKEILKDLSLINKENEGNNEKINVQAPPSVQPKKEQHQPEPESDDHKEREQKQQEDKNLPKEQNAVVGGDDAHHNERDSPLEVEKRVDQEREGEGGEQVVVKRAIDKKKEDYSYDYNGDFDEHGRPKDEENKREQEVVHDVEEGVGDGHRDTADGGGQKEVGEGGLMFGTAVKALVALSNFKKMVSETFKGKLEEKGLTQKPKKEGEEDKHVNEGEVPKKSEGIQNFDSYDQNSQFFNGRPMSGELLVEFDPNRHERPLSAFEAAGNNIMFTLRTTKSYHDKRLPLLFETWMRKANHSNIFIVTDGEDKKWLKKAWNENMHYILTSCGKTYLRNELCCKAGIELALIFKEQSEHYDWLCHIDDDIYVNVKQLVKFLSKFDPKKEAIYFGRSGSGWETPRKVMDGALYGSPGQKYHFAVGGMYCLSRPTLELSKPYLIGGKNFAKSCSRTLEPEDVTVGVVVGVVLNKTLSRTEAIYTHGLHLASTVDPYTLPKQIAFAYGYGAIKWGYEPYNAIYVPNALFSYSEDESQFRSLHCHLYPKEKMCLEKQQERERQLQEFRKQISDKSSNKLNHTGTTNR